MMDIRIEPLDPIWVAGMPHSGRYQDIPQTWERFCAWLAQNGMPGPIRPIRPI